MREIDSPGVAQAAPGSRPNTGAFDWRRFWIRSLLAALAFNVVAALVTWFWIFPHLFPSR